MRKLPQYPIHSLFVGLILTISGVCKAQDSCVVLIESLNNIETLAGFGFANDPAAFKRLVDSSGIGQTLTTCPELFSESFTTTNTNIVFSKARKRFPWIIFAKTTTVSAQTELKTAVIIAAYAYQPAADLEKLKEFVRSKPWERGLVFASHLAVDALLLRNNDPNRDAVYHTYSPLEMERARLLYALE